MVLSDIEKDDQIKFKIKISQFASTVEEGLSLTVERYLKISKLFKLIVSVIRKVCCISKFLYFKMRYV